MCKFSISQNISPLLCFIILAKKKGACVFKDNINLHIYHLYLAFSALNEYLLYFPEDY